MFRAPILESVAQSLRPALTGVSKEITYGDPMHLTYESTV